MRILRGRMGADRPEIWQASGEDLLKVVGIPGLARLYEEFLGTDPLLALAARLRPYESQSGGIGRLLGEALEDLQSVLSARGDGAAVVKTAAARMWASPRRGGPGDLPVVGITGDLYTRVNEAGNHHLMARLEAMGCEVWLGASWAAHSDLAPILDAPQAAGQGRIRDLGPATSNLIVVAVARLVDFLRRGAACAISAAGVNCAVGGRHSDSGNPRRLRGCTRHQPFVRRERRARRQNEAGDLRATGHGSPATGRRVKECVGAHFAAAIESTWMVWVFASIVPDL